MDIVKLLLNSNADKCIVAEKGETPLSLASRPEVKTLLGGGGEVSGSAAESSLPIAPNYLKNPPINGKVDLYPLNGGNHRKHNGLAQANHQTNHLTSSPLSPIDGE